MQQCTHILHDNQSTRALDKGSATSQCGSGATLWCCPARAQTRCEDGTNAARPPWWSLREQRRTGNSQAYSAIPSPQTVSAARGAPKQTLWLSMYMMCFYLWYIFFVIMGCAVCRTLRRKIKSHFQGQTWKNKSHRSLFLSLFYLDNISISLNYCGVFGNNANDQSLWLWVFPL